LRQHHHPFPFPLGSRYVPVPVPARTYLIHDLGQPRRRRRFFFLFRKYVGMAWAAGRLNHPLVTGGKVKGVGVVLAVEVGPVFSLDCHDGYELNY
jgi:hypothetical protein